MTTETTTDQGDALRSMGVQVDAGADANNFSESDNSEASQPQTVEKTTPEPVEEAKDNTPAETETKSTKSADTSSEKPAAAESPWMKEKARQAKAWREIQDTKEELRSQLAELKEAKQAAAPKQSAFRDEAGYTAQDYEAAASRAWKEAQEARTALDEDKAAEAEGFVQQFQQLANQARQKEFHAHRQAVAQQMVKDIPELGDPKSPLRLATDELLKAHESLRLHPEGLKLAPLMARAQMDAKEVPALKAKIEVLTKENERLVKLTSVGGSGPARRGGESNGNLTEADLRRMAEAHDQAA